MDQQNEKLYTLRGVWPEVVEDDDMELYENYQHSKQCLIQFLSQYLILYS